MIDKFNFYDVYGYFLPGTALLLLLWLPFGLVNNSWPPRDLASAIIGVVLAYFTGHFLQMICTRVIPSSVDKGKDGHDRYPSDVVVDLGNKRFSPEFKTSLAELVKKKFKLDIGIDKPDIEAVDMVRRDAFFMARHQLIQAKEVSYGEQFEGLYSLMRGLCAAFGLACGNYIGWSISVLHRGWLDCIVVVVITVSLLATGNFSAHLLRKGLAGKTSLWLERLSAVSLVLAGVGLGYGMGRRYAVTASQAGVFALCAMGALTACLRTYGSYKSYSMHFAVTIWRDFAASTDKEPPAKTPGN